MKELLYFAFADLMVLVEYEQRSNSLSYASHRKITARERAVLEQYLLARVAMKTDYFKGKQSRFIYLGVEAQLVKPLKHFHRTATHEKEKEIASSVEELINHSLQNFYFEQIGDAIIAMRRELENGAVDAQTISQRQKIRNLVEAYNHYTNQNLQLEEVLPTELKAHFDLCGSPRRLACKVEAID